MKVIAHIIAPVRERLGGRTFEELAQIYPDGRKDERTFACTLALNDARIPKVIERLRIAGFVPWEDKSREMKWTSEFLLSLERSYDPADLNELHYLELAPKNEFPHECPGPYRNEQTGLIELDLHRLDNSLDFARAELERYIVPDRTRRVLLESELSHVMFKPTSLVDPKRQKDGQDAAVPWEKWGPPWWEITSDYTLPPVSSSMDIRDYRGKPLIDRSDPNALHARRDGLYSNAELHYRASDLSKSEPFDLARTWERFGGEMKWNERTLVASKRFYDFCLKHNLKTDWVPVRIDQD